MFEILLKRRKIMAYFQGSGPFYDPHYDDENYRIVGRGHESSYGVRFEQGNSRGPGRATSFDKAQPSVNFCDKIQEGWKPYVRHQGDLFYIDVKNSSTQNEEFGYDNHRHEQSYVDSEHKDIDLSHQHGMLANEHEQNVQRHSKLNGHVSHIDSSKSLVSNRDNSKQYQQSLNDYVIPHHSPSSSIDSSPRTRNTKTISSETRTSTPEKSNKQKYVHLQPDYRKCKNNDSGILLCEKLFGIILCQYNSKSQKQNGTRNDVYMKDRKIIVQDVVPGSDMLLSVNDVEINWTNLEQIFKSMSHKIVKLTFQAPVVIGPKSSSTPSYQPPVPPPTYLQHVNHHTVTATPPKAPPKPRSDNILRLVSGHSNHNMLECLKSCLFTVLYLTLESRPNTESIKEDIIYQFPGEENKLFQIRGLFLTLCGVVPEVTRTSAKSSSLVYQNKKINVTFWSEDQDLFVIGFPEESAFRVAKNKNHLDQLFSLALFSVLQTPDITPPATPSSSHASHLFKNSLHGAKNLNLSDDNKILCDEILSEFEAAEFDDLEEDGLEERRNYSILGTCLFFKEYLICNHLPAGDLRDIYLFLKYHCLLDLVSKQTVQELVIWREVFPTRRCHDPDPNPPGYSEPCGRWFLLVVGMDHFLLATLLEAGGCARQAEGHRGPDPFYVSQAKATLLQLETDDVAMGGCCQERLLSLGGGPLLANADSFLFGGKFKQNDGSHSPLKPQGSPKPVLAPSKSSDSFFKWHSTPHHDRKTSNDENELDRSFSKGSDVSTPVMKRQGSKLSYGSNDSGGSGSSTKGKQLSKAGSVYDMANVNASLSAVGEQKIVRPVRFTRGTDNSLFHYVNLDHSEGVYVGPTFHEMGVVQGQIQEQVLENFHKASLQIRKEFQNSLKILNKDEMDDHDINEADSSKSVIEHGVMFNFTPTYTPENKKVAPPSLTYWVVGRLFLKPQHREMFICFHDAVPQNILELAFKLDFGT
ncbi:hypothetical protein KUTeg_024124 [Tegillarca granosa]|uniref:Protein inturned n=1 Tax=Tegillarca granosa TaxID=220873 RepID=A0ABQ9DWF9_TEGGR|nr:hypothetical protein KUTeg_024124 [Tegillarca granosa]